MAKHRQTHPSNSGSLQGWLKAAAAFSPAILMLATILVYGVNLPFLDELSFVQMVHEFKTVGLSWPLLWAYNNEHLVFVPRLLALPLLLLTNYDSRALMLLSWSQTLVIAWGLLRLARLAAGARPGFTVTLGVTGILFSLVHRATFLDGFQFQMGLPSIMTVLAVVWLAEQRAQGWRLALACSLFLMAGSFSALHGFAAWPLLMVLALALLPRPDNLRVAATLCGAGLLTLALYAARFPGVDRTTDPAQIFRDPLAVFRFWFGLLGAPLVQSVQNARELAVQPVGIFLVIAFLAAAVVLIFHHERKAYPLLACTAFGLGFMALTAIGRSAWGVGVSVTSTRYWCGSALAWAGLLLLAFVLSRRSLLPAPAPLAFSVAILTASVFSSWETLPAVTATSQQRETARTAARYECWIEPELPHISGTPLYPIFDLEGPQYGELVRQSVRMLATDGFLPGDCQSLEFMENPAGYAGNFGVEGELQVSRESGVIVLSGWAVDPDRRRPARTVAVTLQGSRRFLTVVRGGDRETPWVLEHFPVPAYRRAGWRAEFAARMLPQGEYLFDAWVIRERDNRAHRLDRAFVKPVVIR